MDQMIFRAQQQQDQNDVKIINKFGYNFKVGTAAPQTIWDGGLDNTGRYGYGLKDAPNFVDVLSTSAADSGSILIEGLSEDLSEQSETIELNGTTVVTTTQKFSRVFRAYNASDTENLGDINGYVTGSVLQADKVFFIGAEYQQTLMALYTIPKNHTGYAFEYNTTTGKGKETRLYVYIRRPNGVFRLGDLIVSFQNSFTKQVPYQYLPAGTDIEIRGQADANNTNVSARFKIILMDNDLND